MDNVVFPISGCPRMTTTNVGTYLNACIIMISNIEIKSTHFVIVKRKVINISGVSNQFKSVKVNFLITGHPCMIPTFLQLAAKRKLNHLDIQFLLYVCCDQVCAFCGKCI